MVQSPLFPHTGAFLSSVVDEGASTTCIVGGWLVALADELGDRDVFVDVDALVAENTSNEMLERPWSAALNHWMDSGPALVA
jgi:hypothetical protein